MASAEYPQPLSLLSEQELMGTQLSDDPEERARQEAELFLRDTAPRLGRLFGMDLDLHVGNGWSTNMETGEVNIDLKFFLDRGYTPDMAVYAILHETAAHLREVVNEPRLTAKTVEFVKKGPAEAIFHNIFADIAGNNLIHAMLPRMQNVAERTYSQKLFPDQVLDVNGEPQSYASLPRHLQFLYKIIRDEMIPGSETEVSPEVAEAIDGLRDYKGEGDLIKYSTAVSKTNPKTAQQETMRPQERFAIWTEIIYPVYQKLVEEDKKDPSKQGGSGKANDGQAQRDTTTEPQPSQDSGEQTQEQPPTEQHPQNGEGEQKEDQPQPDDGQMDKENNHGESDKPKDETEGEEPVEENNGRNQPAAGEESESGGFQPYYDDYFENRHPEPMSEEDHDKLHEYAQKQSDEKRRRGNINPEKELDKKLRRETGHSLADKRNYEAEMLKWHGAIQRMREVFQGVITERVAIKRGLGRHAQSEGAVLDPDRLAQTLVDVRSGADAPEAFLDYERHKGRTEAVGKTDYIFVFDRSTSMGDAIGGSTIGTKAKAAAACSIIGLEGLSAMQRDVETAEAEHNLDLELEIRTAIYSFGSSTECLKPLSPTLRPKERLDTYAAVQSLNGSTPDFLALEELAGLPKESDRRRIIIVITDGESDDANRAKKAIDALRDQGCLVYGISIGSEDAEILYAPTAKRVDNPDNLPETIGKFIEDTVS